MNIDAGEQLHRRRARHGRLDRPAVLVVDDIADNLLALEGMLRGDDVEVVTARSGREALEVLLEYEVAVAIIDVMMPEMDGFELAELIRGVERTRHIPIIFVTAGSRAEYRVFTGYQTGAIDFLIKPLDERVLRAKVDVLVALERQRRRLDRALLQAEQSRAETEVLLRLAQAAGRCHSPDDLFEPALAAAGELLGAERSAILLADATGVPSAAAWRGLSAEFRIAVTRLWSTSGRDPLALLIPDVDVSDVMRPLRALCAAEGIGAIGFVPLVCQHQGVGTLILAWRTARTFGAHDEALGLAIGAQLGQALTRARLRAAERDAHDRMAHLQRVTASLNRVTTYESIGKQCLPAMCESIGAIAGALVRLDGDELEPVGAVGEPRAARISSRIAADTIRTREPSFVEAGDEEDAGLAVGARAVIPLVVDDRAIGVVGFTLPSQRTIPAEDRALLLVVASQCAQALDRVRLFEAERRAREQAQAAEQRRAAIQHVADAALASLDLEALLRELLARVRRIFTADLVVLHLLDAETRALTIRACDGADVPEWRSVSIPVGSGIAGWIAAEKRPLIIDDLATTDPGWPVLKDRVHSLAGVPLLVGGNLLGVLHVGTSTARTFGRQDIDLLETVAARIASAIDRTVAYEHVRRAEERLRMALDAGRMGVSEWIPATGCVAWSPILEAMHGYEPGSFPGTFAAFEDRIHPEDRARVLAAIRGSVSSRRDHRLEYRIVRTDGTVRWVVACGKVLTDDDGDVTAVTGVWTDVTDLNELARTREAALAELQQSFRFTEMFMAILSHDLRTPISSIGMAAELIALNGPLAPAQHDLIRRVTTSVQRMGRMVSQLLDVTRSRLAGGIAIERASCDLVQIARAAIAESELAHPSRRFELDGVPTMIGMWDPDRLAQVLSNLLGNAVSHGSIDTVIRVSVTGDGDVATLRVHNGGPPIPANVLPTIFDPYVRGHGNVEAKGLGLGLYITSRIVHAHGGTIAVHSTAEYGTELTVALPLA